MAGVSRSFEFPIHFQRSLVGRALQDEQFGIKAKRVLKPEHLDFEPLKWICRKFLFEKATTLTIIVDILKRETKFEKIKPELRVSIAEELKLINRQPNKKEAEYGLDKLIEFVENQELQEGLLRAATDLKEGHKADFIRGNLKKLVHTNYADERIKTVNLLEDTINRFEAREKAVKEGKVIFIPTGVKQLDEELLGPMPGQVWSFFGDTNIGKSAFAVNIGRTCMVSGFPVWHVVVEDQFEATTQRYDASITKTNYHELTFASYSREEKIRIDKIFDLLKKYRSNNLYLSKIEEGCNMLEIEQEYDRIRDVYGFQPMAIILDSPHCMEPTIRRNDPRMTATQIYIDIRKFTRREKVAMFLLDQSKMEAQGKRLGTKAFSESYDKARIADGFIQMLQTKNQKHEGILELYIAKMKDRQKEISYFIRPRLGIMRFDSIVKEEE